MSVPQSPYPATVNIAQLPLGRSPLGTDILSAVQVVVGITESVQLTISQLGSAIPTATGAFGGISLATNAFPYGQGIANASAVGPANSTGFPLLSNGSVAPPTFGVLPTVGGGIGTTSLPNFTVLLGSGSSAISVSTTATSGQVLVGQNSTNFPVWETVTGDIALTAGGIATIANSAVTLADIQQAGAGTLLGNRTGNTAVITAATSPLLGTGSATGSLTLVASSTSVITLAPGTTSFLSYTMQLPASWGAPGQFLQSGGAGTPAIFTTIPVQGIVNFSSLATSVPPLGFSGVTNFGFTPSVLAGILTLTLTNSLGSTPSATSPIYVPFSSGLGTALTTWSVITGSASMTTAIGANFNTVNNQPFRLWLALFFSTATTVIPALINCSNVSTNAAVTIPPPLNLVGSTFLMSSLSTQSGRFFSNTVVNSGTPFRIVGYMDWNSGLPNNGTFSLTPSSVCYVAPDTPRPGQVIQVVSPSQAAAAPVTFSTSVTLTNVGAAITPISPVNPIKYTAVFTQNYTGLLGTANAALYINGQIQNPISEVSATSATISVTGVYGTNSLSLTPITFTVVGVTSAGNALIPAATGESFTMLEEIMG
jgi:hypothetical protein